MIKYFKPLEIINWIKENKDNTEELKNILGNTLYSEMKSDYIHKDFLGCFNTCGIIKFLHSINNYVEHVDSKYNPEEKCEVVESLLGNGIAIEIRGKKYIIEQSMLDEFFYDKKDLVDMYGDINQDKMYLPNDNSLVTTTKSLMQVKNEREKVENQMKALEEEYKAEMERMQKDFELKMSEMKLAMAEKTISMVKNACDMKDEASNMERRIYRWLSYNGQTFELETIADGSSAKSDDKFVIWQKLRYLDEELPKLTTYEEIMKDVNFGNFSTFENLLKTYSMIRDYFLPSPKCCVAFQLSRKREKECGYFQTIADVCRGSNGKKSVKTWVEYIASTYRVANWNKIGLFFRNGEKIYVAWLDADKINIGSDSLFITNADNEDTEEFKSNFVNAQDINKCEEKYKGDVALNNIKIMEKNYEEKIRIEDKINSRVYILDIIQGILDRETDVMEVKKGQNVLEALTNKSFKDVIFNSADGYISDLKWKNYEEMSKEFLVEDKDIKVGDNIYVLVSDGGKDRGRKNTYRDMTSYAKITKGVNEISLIEFEDTYMFYKYVDKNSIEKISNEGKLVYSINDNCNSKLYYTVNGNEKTAKCESVYVWGIKNFVYYYEIEDFDDAENFRLEYKVENIDTKRKVEEPTNSRLKKSKYANYWNRETKKYEYSFEEQNEVYKKCKSIIELGFIEDIKKRHRNYYFYIKGNSWGENGVNVRIYREEFIPMKKITEEHLQYMMNNKFKLPSYNSHAESLSAILEMNEKIKNRK